MSSTETSWISILMGAVALGGATLVGYIVKRFDPDHQQKVKAEEAEAEAETWRRAKELIATYSAEKAESDKKIAKLDARLEEEIARRTKLEEELKIEIKKRDEEIADLRKQIAERDKKIEELMRASKRRGMM